MNSSLELFGNTIFKKYFIATLLIAIFILAGMLSNYMDYFLYILLLISGWVAFKQGFKIMPKEIKVFNVLGVTFFVLITFSIVFNQNFHLLFAYRYEIFKILLFLPLLTLLLLYANFEEQAIWKIVVLGGLFTVYLSVYLLMYPTDRSTGILEIPITRGNLGMLFGMLSLVAFFGLQDKRWKVVALIVFFSGVLLSLLSGSRGGWLSLVLGVAIIIIVNRKLNRVAFLISVFLAVFVISLAVLFWEYIPIAERLNLVLHDITVYFNGDAQTSVGYRLEMWKASFMSFLDNPLWGAGFYQFDKYYALYASQNIVIESRPGGWGHAHSDYFTFLGEMGSVGLISMLSILLYPAFLFLKRIKNSVYVTDTYIPLAGLILVESIMEFMMTDETLTEKFIFIVYIIFVVLFLTHKPCYRRHSLQGGA